MLLTADLGWNVVEPFAQAYPERFVNVGVAEQNMLGIATGLCRSDMSPTSTRLPRSVRCGVTSRFGTARVAPLAGAHHRDWRRLRLWPCRPDPPCAGRFASTRTQPGLKVIVPADRSQLQSALAALQGLPGPAYLRIAKANVPGGRRLAGGVLPGTLPRWFGPAGTCCCSTGEMAHHPLGGRPAFLPRTPRLRWPSSPT